MQIQGVTIDSVDMIDKNETKVSFLKGQETQRLVVFQMLKNIECPGQLELDTDINLQFGKTVIMYNHSMVERLAKIFELKTNEELIQAGWDKIDQKLDEGQVSIWKLLTKGKIKKSDGGVEPGED